MAEPFKDLPDECCELIFTRLLHDYHLESPSLACKRFLSIINSLRTHFTITHPTIFIHGTLSKLFRRFPNLKSIDLSSFGGDLDRAILEIAASNLNLKILNLSGNKRLPLEGLKLLGWRMKNLKVLSFSCFRTFRDVELHAVADSMPCLEELDICYLVNDLGSDPQLRALSPGEVGLTDGGIVYLSARLKGLRRIDISGNEFLTDKSLFALSSNCVLLEKIVVLNCSLVTPNGIEFVMRNSPNLSSLSVRGIIMGRWGMHLSFTDHSLTSTRNLSVLDIYDSVIHDDYLHLLAKAGFPLKKFTLAGCSSFTLSGISSLLNTYRSLEHLALTRIVFFTDKEMCDLSRYLSAVVTIVLDFCSNLTESTFFALAKNCPLLRNIHMVGTNLGGRDSTADILMNPRIKSVKLGKNLNLTDECLRKVAYVCSGLETLDVSCCKGITEKGIANFFKDGSKIRHLVITDCWEIKNIGAGFELPKFEVLQAIRTGINDEGLAIIGNRCCGMLTLNLECCLGVTVVGLEAIVTNCKRLRELNLKWCVNVRMGTADWMVFSRPSLRKLVVPCSSLPTESQRNLLLRHGCLVRPGVGKLIPEFLP
ncbi:F-box/LRR-repeat protein [Actinidia chinensis var. chinensis]|uniref:F-box/LRR-repeat protein n=1 Tax=Actinidia chinensis var. chinensis TaxID=1590841 RepID=A0A2R6QG06_ACTCC|nr:F-box/LRR-repeat protein [Actinidia chinensis var. chinensis]